MSDPRGGTPPGKSNLIGPYRLERELARGGMGIVYLAHDTRLNRTVALKALPDDVASDPDRLQRFEREARLLASLSHPNVATIYGIESGDGRRFLALEYIEGESLAARLAHGPLSLDETLEIGAQIAAGIEAAHEAGIIHRDLKPANVVIAAGERVKVIDFGLARGKEADASSQADSPAITPSSPTITRAEAEHSPTMPGVILGTAPYLSPEQARGKPVDRRTDIWSYGCLLFECLTGTMAFRGETVSDTISLILTKEPDWSKLPKQTPAALAALLKRCLVKDPRRRLRDIGEARLALEDIRAGGPAGSEATVAAAPASAPAPNASPAWRSRARLQSLGTGLLGFIVAGAMWNLVLNKPRQHEGGDVTHLSIPLDSGFRAYGGGLLAPDGRTFVVMGLERNSDPGRPPRSQLYVRRLDENAFKPLRGTERVQGFILSRDGRWVEYITTTSDYSPEMQIFKVPIDGSAPPVFLMKSEDNWGKPILLYSGDQLMPLANGKEYVRLPANGGAPSKPIPYGSDASVLDMFDVLPHDRGVLVTMQDASGVGLNVGVLDLRSGKTKTLIQDSGRASYSPSGHLVFSRGSTLLAVPFDLGSLEAKGQPVAIQDGLRVPPGVPFSPFQVTASGTLLYLSGGDISHRQAIVVDSEGRVSEWSPERQPYQIQISGSPDGSRFASLLAASGRYEIWISDRGSDRARRLVGVPDANVGFPAWSHDGRQIAFYEQGGDKSGVYVVPSNGDSQPHLLAKVPANGRFTPSSWSPDGRTLLATRYDAFRGVLYSIDVLAGTGKDPEPLFGKTLGQSGAKFSPDGRVIAYSSDETGQDEVYVCGYDVVTRKPEGRSVQVSRGGGNNLRWGRDGKQLYFLTPENKVEAAAITRAPDLSAEAPRVIWDIGAIGAAVENSSTPYDILPDGRLLAIRRGPEEGEITHYDLALNFDKELKAKVGK
jgi:serine/threonine-protein kinase